MFSPFEKSGNREEDDRFFLELVSSYLDREDDKITNLANLSALLAWYLEDISWVGFYLLDKDILRLGPFQGKPACTRLRIGKGVCGTAYKENRTLIVPDVNAFPGHIACDGDSRSEIVVPLEGFGVLDIDSTSYNRFKEEDQTLLQGILKLLTKVI